MLSHIFKSILLLFVTIFICYPLFDKLNDKKYDGDKTYKNILGSINQERWLEQKNHLKTLHRTQNFTKDSSNQRDATNSSKQNELRDFPKHFHNAYLKSNNKSLKTFQVEGRENESKIVRQDVLEKTLLSNKLCDKEDANYLEKQDTNVKEKFVKTTYANILKKQISTRNNYSDEDGKIKLSDTNILKDKMANTENTKTGNQRNIIINNTILPGQPNGSLQSKTNKHSSQIPLISDKVLQESSQCDSVPTFKAMTYANIIKLNTCTKNNNLKDGNIDNSHTHILEDNECCSKNIKGNTTDIFIIDANDLPGQHDQILESETKEYLSKNSICNSKISKQLPQYSSVSDKKHTQSSYSFQFSSVNKETPSKASCTYQQSTISEKTLSESPHITQENSTISLTLPSILNSSSELSLYPTTHNETQLQLQFKPVILLAMTFSDRDTYDLKPFSSITVENEEIYTLNDFQKFSKRSIHSLKKFSDEMKYRLSTLRNHRKVAVTTARNKIKNKVLLTFRSVQMLSILNTVHPVADIRDVLCLTKYINVITQHSRREEFTLKELTYYFLGEEIQNIKSSINVANAIKRLYMRFEYEWELEIKNLIKNGKLNEILSPREVTIFPYWKEYETDPYTGIHCDPFEYKFHLTIRNGNQHFFYSMDIEWNERENELLLLTKVQKCGAIRFQAKNVKINSKFFKQIQKHMISDLTIENCRFITVGHGIIKPIRKLIGLDVTSYENLIDLQLQFYLRKNEPINNTLNYLAEKYLHIIVPKQTDGHMRAKMCMQLYRLYRFELGVDEFWYGELIKSKKYCLSNSY